MRAFPSRPRAALATAVAAVALAGCGNKTTSIHGGETEGIYVNVGPLVYQVQISRELNPGAIPEDRTFVQDIAPAEAQLGPDELWFAVFVRVENPTGSPQPPAGEYTITDQEGNVFHPVQIGAGNPFRFATQPIAPHSVAPDPDSVAGELRSTNGMELLFKLKRATLDNRPLELAIKSVAPEDEATVNLDV